MKQTSILLFLILNIHFLNSQPMAQQMDLKELGVRFEIPDGWTGGVQGDYLLLGHETIDGMMILFQNNGKTAHELRSLAMQGIMEEGVALSPLEDFQIINSTRVEGNYVGRYNGTPVKAFAVGLVNSLGSGLSFLILTETGRFTDIHANEANKLLETVAFYQPLRENNKEVQFWKSRLMGKKLKYMLTTSSTNFNGGSAGSSETKIVDLCANGNFRYYANSHAAIDTGTNAGRFHNDSDVSLGKYEIYYANDTTWLKMEFENGEVFEGELSTDDQNLKTYIDGSRFYLNGDAVCQ